jgi:hypothetical protein
MFLWGDFQGHLVMGEPECIGPIKWDWDWSVKDILTSKFYQGAFHREEGIPSAFQTWERQPNSTYSLILVS